MSQTPQTPPRSPATVHSSGSVTLSRSPSPTAPTEDEAHNRTPLWFSLLEVADNTLALSQAVVESIAKDNNPRPLRQLMRDGAEYWVKSTGDLLCIRFPARVDRNGMYGRLGPYFNIPPMGVSVSFNRGPGTFD